MVFGLSRLYMCSECKGKFKFEDVRYSSDGKKVICKDCYSRVKNQGKNEVKVVLPNETVSDYVKLICTNCRYKFSLRKKSRFNLICPYCGGNQLIKDDITADKLIRELSQTNPYE